MPVGEFDLIPTEKLVDEIFKRFDDAVLIAYRHEPGREDRESMSIAEKRQDAHRALQLTHLASLKLHGNILGQPLDFNL